MRSQQSEFQQVIHKLLVLNGVCDENGSRLQPLKREFADQIENPFPGQEDYAPGHRVIHCQACGFNRTTTIESANLYRLKYAPPCARCRAKQWELGYAPARKLAAAGD